MTAARVRAGKLLCAKHFSASGARLSHLSDSASHFGKDIEVSYRFPGSLQRVSTSQKTFKTAWHATLRRAKVPSFGIYDHRSTYATRLRAGGVADEWVTQLLRQGDAKVFKKYSQMKLQMKREALAKLNRQANETGPGFGTAQARLNRVLAQ
jgi:hypothetical protein